MVPKLNQQLKTMDVIGVCVLMTVVIGLSSVIISREMRDSHQATGLDEARNLAFQLANGGFVNSRPDPRQPASEKNTDSTYGVFRSAGEIGQDPWGAAFRYLVLRDPAGDPTHVVVWSSGPNRQRETQGGDLKRGSMVSFVGDDFGYIHRTR